MPSAGRQIAGTIRQIPGQDCNPDFGSVGWLLRKMSSACAEYPLTAGAELE